MKENDDDRVKEWWPSKNGTLIGKLEDDSGVDDHDIAESINQVPCHLGSYMLVNSERLMKICYSGYIWFLR